jgi:hypothetical protein
MIAAPSVKRITFTNILLHTYASAGLRKGARRRRTPVASKTALAMAAATGWIELSPAPAGGSSGG